MWTGFSSPPPSLPSYFSLRRLVRKKTALPGMADSLLPQLSSRAPSAPSLGTWLQLHVGPPPSLHWLFTFCRKVDEEQKGGTDTGHLCPGPGSCLGLDFSLLHPRKLVVLLTSTLCTGPGSGMKIRQILTGAERMKKYEHHSTFRNLPSP